MDPGLAWEPPYGLVADRHDLIKSAHLSRLNEPCCAMAHLDVGSSVETERENVKFGFGADRP
jgi:hypothetical protein